MKNTHGADTWSDNKWTDYSTNYENELFHSPGACSVRYIWLSPRANIAAAKHRQQFIRSWGIPPGAKVLEIGPGQVDFSVVLADAVRPTGHAVAIDPAPSDWKDFLPCCL